MLLSKPCCIQRVNVDVPQGSNLGPKLLYLSDLPDDVSCSIAIYTDDLLSLLSVIKHLIWGNT